MLWCGAGVYAKPDCEDAQFNESSNKLYVEMDFTADIACLQAEMTKDDGGVYTDYVPEDEVVPEGEQDEDGGDEDVPEGGGDEDVPEGGGDEDVPEGGGDEDVPEGGGNGDEGGGDEDGGDEDGGDEGGGDEDAQADV